MANKRTREERKADNIRNETQRRINAGDNSSYVQSQIRNNPGQFTNTVQSYRAGLSPSGATKQEPREITLADGKKMMTYGSFQPGQFAGNQYDGIVPRLKSDKKNLGLSSLTQAGPYQNFGFGSVFSSSSGSTASSQAVQNSIRAMTEDLYNQGYSEPVAAQIAMDKMYPGYIDYSQGKGDIPVNFMDMNEGNPLPGHKMIMDDYTPGSLGGGYGGGYGGGGYDYGYGGGGGNAAAYSMMNQGPKQLGAGENVPGQAELLDYMINVNSNNPYTQLAMPQMAAGGIMGLME